MGLRVGTNSGALTALRNLRRNSAAEVKTLERMSTGMKINRGSDNPAGLVVFQQLRGDLFALDQAISNTQSAQNLVNVADQALVTISDRLVDLRGNVIAALNTGFGGPESQTALRDAINQSLNAIDRVGATTRFGDQNLLNGNLAFQITNASNDLEEINVQGGSFNGSVPTAVQVNVSAAATRAEAGGQVSAVQSGSATVNITGSVGTEQLSFSAGATLADVTTAINSVSEYTGVEATAAGVVQSVGFGSSQSVKIEEVSGDLDGIDPGIANGTDIVATVDGQTAGGRGSTIEISSNQIQANIRVSEGSVGNFTFTVAGGGATFQLGPVAGGADDVTIGIGPVNSFTLGGSSGLGSLSSIRSGGANSFDSNPGGALAVLNAAVGEVGSLRGQLGSLSRNVFQVNVDAAGVAFQNLSASSSELADANFAEELTMAVRNKLVRESGLRVLAQANMNPGIAMRLLAF
ncbi:MAG: flagellin [Planctomycetota bacterium]|nr:flagellin [Planctomycetota bacterium]